MNQECAIADLAHLEFWDFGDCFSNPVGMIGIDGVASDIHYNAVKGGFDDIERC